MHKYAIWDAPLGWTAHSTWFAMQFLSFDLRGVATPTAKPHWSESHSAFLNIKHQTQSDWLPAIVSRTAASVARLGGVSVFNLIVRVNIGLGGWTKFGPVWQFSKHIHLYANWLTNKPKCAYIAYCMHPIWQHWAECTINAFTYFTSKVTLVQHKSVFMLTYRLTRETTLLCERNWTGHLSVTSVRVQ